jgi:hypothetical protein
MSTATPPAAGEGSASEPGAIPGSGRPRALRRRPLLVALGACLFGGVVSLATLPPGLGSDSWAWLVWGRELLHGGLDPTNGPSWKPLPVLLTTPLVLAGEGAPVLWAVVARAGALLALVFAYRVAARAAGRVAGAFAVLALIATDLLDLAASGDSEPLAAAFLLWGLERHLEGRRSQALLLLALAALGRPEAWVLLVAYGAFVCTRDRRLAPGALAAAFVPPLLWLGPPWLATGDPLSAGERANRVTEASLATASFPALAVVATVVGLAGLPVVVAALVGAAAALTGGRRRRGRGPSIGLEAGNGAPPRSAEAAHGERDAAPGAGRARVSLARDAPTIGCALGAGALVWVALVACLTQAGFTGNERYLFPPVAALCVLAGIGAGAIVHALTGGQPRREVLAALALLVLAAPFGLVRARDALGYRAEAAERAATIAGLQRVVARAGGARRVIACGSPAVARPGTQGTLAWDLGVPLSAVARAWPPDPRVEVRSPAAVFSRTERRFDVLSVRGMLAPGHVAAPLPWRSQGWRTFAVAPGPVAARAAAARCTGRSPR